MQRPDGHFMSSAKGHDATIQSPPSASDEERVYFDGTSPSGDGWSGGGVTIEQATGQAVLALAHAAVVYDSVGVVDSAERYRQSALDGWTWLASATMNDEVERRTKRAAAAAVYRLDPSVASASRTVRRQPTRTAMGPLAVIGTTAQEFAGLRLGRSPNPCVCVPWGPSCSWWRSS